MARAAGPIRILHVVGGMDRGGIETWLMHVLRHIDRDRYRMDFVVHTARPCAYNDEIRALGCDVIPCPEPARPWSYAGRFKRILRERGPYAVVHSHVHFHSGFVLRYAAQAGVPACIAHSHIDEFRLRASAGPVRRAYLALTQRWIASRATAGLAASRKQAADLFGPRWEADSRWRVLHYGIDTRPFHERVDPGAVRAELGIPPGAFVVGHVGRFARQKHDAFLLAVAARLAACEPNLHLLLVGTGPLRLAIEEAAARLGLTDRVIFAGPRADVPRLMRGAMDVFLFPSLFEGLGLVLIEAQAAGVPCVVSDVVPGEADVVAACWCIGCRSRHRLRLGARRRSPCAAGALWRRPVPWPPSSAARSRSRPASGSSRTCMTAEAPRHEHLPAGTTP